MAPSSVHQRQQPQVRPCNGTGKERVSTTASYSSRFPGTLWLGDGNSFSLSPDKDGLGWVNFRAVWLVLQVGHKTDQRDTKCTHFHMSFLRHRNHSLWIKGKE